MRFSTWHAQQSCSELLLYPNNGLKAQQWGWFDTTGKGCYDILPVFTWCKIIWTSVGEIGSFLIAKALILPHHCHHSSTGDLMWMCTGDGTNGLYPTSLCQSRMYEEKSSAGSRAALAAEVYRSVQSVALLQCYHQRRLLTLWSLLWNGAQGLE